MEHEASKTFFGSNWSITFQREAQAGGGSGVRGSGVVFGPRCPRDLDPIPFDLATVCDGVSGMCRLTKVSTFTTADTATAHFAVVGVIHFSDPSLQTEYEKFIAGAVPS